MAPSARSLAAHTQFRREQRWADVVVLRGEAPASAAGVVRIRGAAPTVLHLADDAARWCSAPVPSRALRLAARADALVVRGPDDVAVADRLGIPTSRVHVVSYGVEPGPPITAARTDAARRQLGLPSDAFVALVLGDEASRRDVIEQALDLGVHCTTTDPADDRVVHFGAEEVADPVELSVAAADVVVAAVQDGDALQWELLRAAGSGLAVVGPQVRVIDPLADRPTGWPQLADAVDAGRDEAGRRGQAAAVAVGAGFSSGRAADAWMDLLSRLTQR